MKLTNKHPLVGTWITDDEDSDAAFVIKVVKGRFVVSGFCRSDGEKFKITETRWENESLSFNALMPSTQQRSRNAFRVRPDGKADLELTIWEVWKKMTAKPKQLPKTRIKNPK